MSPPGIVRIIRPAAAPRWGLGGRCAAPLATFLALPLLLLALAASIHAVDACLHEFAPFGKALARGEESEEALIAGGEEVFIVVVLDLLTSEEVFAGVFAVELEIDGVDRAGKDVFVVQRLVEPVEVVGRIRGLIPEAYGAVAFGLVGMAKVGVAGPSAPAAGERLGVFGAVLKGAGDSHGRIALVELCAGQLFVGGGEGLGRHEGVEEKRGAGAALRATEVDGGRGPVDGGGIEVLLARVFETGHGLAQLIDGDLRGAAGAGGAVA